MSLEDEVMEQIGDFEEMLMKERELKEEERRSSKGFK